MEGDRRSAPREFRVLRAIGRTMEGQEVLGTIENLSVGGAFFVCDAPDAAVRAGDAVSVEITYRLEESGVEAGVLRCPARVLRVEEYGSGAGAMKAFALNFNDPIHTFGLDLGES